MGKFKGTSENWSFEIETENSQTLFEAFKLFCEGQNALERSFVAAIDQPAPYRVNGEKENIQESFNNIARRHIEEVDAFVQNAVKAPTEASPASTQASFHLIEKRDGESTTDWVKRCQAWALDDTIARWKEETGQARTEEAEEAENLES